MRTGGSPLRGLLTRNSPRSERTARERTAAALIAFCMPVAACSTPATNDVTDAASEASMDIDASDAMDGATVDTAPEASADVPLPRDPLSWSVDRLGPFAVSYRTFDHTYMPAGSTTPRTIPISIWYPTLAPNSRHPRYFNIFVDRDTSVDAPLAEPVYPRGYPVHVYSHGHRGFGATSHFLMHYFASHGWIAIAPDHIGDTLMDGTDPAPVPIHHLRVQDIRETLDVLENLPASDPLAHLADTQRVLLSGHSFGSETTWALAGAHYDVDAIRANCIPAMTCTEADLTVFGSITGDPRVMAAIPMAGTINPDWFGTDGHTFVHIPLFSMSGTADPVGADVQFMNAVGNDLTWIEVTGACHQFFALGGCTEIPDTEQEPIVGTYALALGRRRVLDDTDPTVAAILDGSRTVSSLVSFHRRSP